MSTKGFTSAGRGGRSIARQVLLAQLSVVVLITAIAAAIALRANRSQVAQLSGERALAIAKSVAAIESIRDAFTIANPELIIQPIAEAIRKSSGADFVVVANREQVRYSHPDPTKIGQRLSTEAGAVLKGEDFIGTEQGTLGRSVRGKTPIVNQQGEVIGLVSVGLLISGVDDRSRSDLLRLIGWLAAAALALGGAGTWLIARRVDRQTHSLNAEGIGSLLEHRATADTLRAQAHEFSNTLHTIAGLIALDAHDEVREFIARTTNAHAAADSAVGERIGEPLISALLLAKMSLARERNVELTLDPQSKLKRLSVNEATDLLLVVGNLVDNAIDAAGPAGWVHVRVSQDHGQIGVVVSDSGTGPQDNETVFSPGYTTKTGRHAGLGLTLTRQTCRASGGSVRIVDREPTTFEAVLVSGKS
jgi:sensor histidine kinase regulating citrate/malate metabolism